jgi:hypothetical protein
LNGRLETEKFFCQDWTTFYVCGRHKSQRYKLEKFDACAQRHHRKKQTLLLIEEKNAQTFQTSGRKSFLESIQGIQIWQGMIS